MNLDLLLENRSAYTPENPALNALNGKFAQINLACNAEVLLRVTIVESCSAPAVKSCVLCDDEIDPPSCYEQGCTCFGTTVTTMAGCSGLAKQAARNSYNCSKMHETTTLPTGALVSMTARPFLTTSSRETRGSIPW
mgnify:CR=1 FL=1